MDLRFSGELPLRLRDQDRHQALEEELLDPARFLILLAVEVCLFVFTCGDAIVKCDFVFGTDEIFFSYL